IFTSLAPFLRPNFRLCPIHSPAFWANEWERLTDSPVSSAPLRSPEPRRRQSHLRPRWLRFYVRISGAVPHSFARFWANEWECLTDSPVSSAPLRSPEHSASCPETPPPWLHRIQSPACSSPKPPSPAEGTPSPPRSPPLSSAAPSRSPIP